MFAFCQYNRVPWKYIPDSSFAQVAVAARLFGLASLVHGLKK